MSYFARLTRDQRIGYAGVAAGACLFLTVLVSQGNFVRDTIDNIIGPPSDATDASSVVVDGPMILRASDGTTADNPAGSTSTTGSSTDAVTTPGDPGRQDFAPVPGTGTPGRPLPAPQAPAKQGLASRVVDPLAKTVTSDVLDGATGGATKPVTAPLYDTVDSLTDTIDALVPVITLSLGIHHVVPTVEDPADRDSPTATER